VLGRRTEPGGDQDGAELVAVQPDGVRLVIEPGSADVRRRGVLEEFFFDGVLVEPGDGAYPPGDGGVGPAFSFQVAGEGLDVGGRTADRDSERVRHQALNWRRSRMYASRVRPR